MIKVFQKRCKHRHTANSHPHCFVDGSPVEGGYSPKNSKYAKVLIVDTENLPGKFSLWGTGKQYVAARHMIEAPIMLAWSAKWLYDHEIYSRILTTKQVKNRDNSKLVGELWNLMNDADIVVGHNIKFDIAIINTLLAKNGYPPPLDYKVIDTLPIARAAFKLPSYSLEYINEYFGLSPKLKTSPGLWDRCEEGDEESLVEMLEYNQNDVYVEEETYTFLRPWMKSHPELAIYVNSNQGGVCRCGSTNIENSGIYSTNRARYQSYRCSDCGAIGRFTQNLLTKKESEK